MGLTPLDGLVMGTRSSDVDPGLLGYLASRTGMSVDELTRALNIDSGLEGVSGAGNDMRTVVAAAAGGNERARPALEVFVHGLSKAVAGLVVGLQRLDALVFTGGIGENSAVVRSLVLSQLGFLGMAEDVAANADHGRHTGGRISLAGPVLAVGVARTCLGLVRALDRRGVNVAFVKPVAQPRPDGSPDRSVALVAAISALRPAEPLSTAQLEQQLGAGGVDAVLEKTVAAWEPVYERSDVVIVEGLSPGPAWLYASEINQALARALDADVLVVGRWPTADEGRQDRAGQGAESRPDLTTGIIDDLAETLAITASGYLSGERARVVGCVIRSLPATVPSAAVQLGEALSRHGLRLIAAVPHRPELAWLRVRDLVRELDPQVLYEGDLSRRIKNVAVFAQGVPGGLRVLTEGRLVVAPGDRHEVVMAACLAALNGTRLAGLLLSAGIVPDPRVWDLTRAASATGLPVLVVDDDSFETATRVRDLDPGLPVDDLERIERVVNSIADALDVSW